MQGPPNNRHQPLLQMVGTSHEYLIDNAKGGYRPHHENQGPVRTITRIIWQVRHRSHNYFAWFNLISMLGGYNVEVVISHDVTLSSPNPWYASACTTRNVQPGH